MNEVLSTEPEASWDNVAPHLDAALGDLNEPDREALLLRFFERKSAREMAQVLGISDEAAQKRVNRAVDRLRDTFSRQGVKLATGGLVALVSAHAVQAAPGGLAITISAAAPLAASAASNSAAFTAAKTVSASAFQKGLVVAGIVATAAGSLVVEQHSRAQLQEEVRSLRQVDNISQKYLPRESWKFVGFDTPEDAFQSSAWAVENHNYQGVLDFLTPKLRQRFKDTKSPAAKAEILRYGSSVNGINRSELKEYGIVHKDVRSDHEVILHIWRADYYNHGSIIQNLLKKVDGKWKLAAQVGRISEP